MNKLLTLIILCAFFLASCASAPEKQIIDEGGLPAENITTTLDGTKWEIEQFQSSLDFENGRYMINAGCNNVSGSYTLENNTINFVSGMSTMMLCDEGTMANEQIMSDLVPSMTEFKITSTQLILKNNEQSLTFTPAKHASITEAQWELSALLINQGVLYDVAFENSSIKFTDDGKVSGTAICNNFMGTYEQNGDSINISKLGLTRKMCAGEDANKYETHIVKTLENVSKLDIQRNSLQLQNEDDSYRINYSVN